MLLRLKSKFKLRRRLRMVKSLLKQRKRHPRKRLNPKYVTKLELM